jgi:hypothetical protein
MAGHHLFNGDGLVHCDAPVTDHPETLIMCHKPKWFKGNQISNEKIEIQIPAIIGPGVSVNDVWEFYKVEFVFDPKTSFHVCDLFC